MSVKKNSTILFLLEILFGLGLLSLLGWLGYILHQKISKQGSTQIATEMDTHLTIALILIAVFFTLFFFVYRYRRSEDQGRFFNALVRLRDISDRIHMNRSGGKILDPKAESDLFFLANYTRLGLMLDDDNVSNSDILAVYTDLNSRWSDKNVKFLDFLKRGVKHGSSKLEGLTTNQLTRLYKVIGKEE